MTLTRYYMSKMLVRVFNDDFSLSKIDNVNEHTTDTRLESVTINYNCYQRFSKLPEVQNNADVHTTPGLEITTLC